MARTTRRSYRIHTRGDRFLVTYGYTMSNHLYNSALAQITIYHDQDRTQVRKTQAPETTRHKGRC